MIVQCKKNKLKTYILFPIFYLIQIAPIQSKVNATIISGNVDEPEGGFDAIMQAIVCSAEIGWRPNTRHLLLFTTDAPFHSAGDGKLGGIVAPNDGKCHLDSNNFYDFSLEQDYPSISQINRMAKDHSVNIIFAVTQDQMSIYESVSGLVEGSSYAELNNDSSNVAELVQAEYNVSRNVCRLV